MGGSYFYTVAQSYRYPKIYFQYGTFQDSRNATPLNEDHYIE